MKSLDKRSLLVGTIILATGAATGFMIDSSLGRRATPIPGQFETGRDASLPTPRGEAPSLPPERVAATNSGQAPDKPDAGSNTRQQARTFRSTGALLSEALFAPQELAFEHFLNDRTFNPQQLDLPQEAANSIRQRFESLHQKVTVTAEDCAQIRQREIQTLADAGQTIPLPSKNGNPNLSTAIAAGGVFTMGLDGSSASWAPLEKLPSTLSKFRELRSQGIELLYEVASSFHSNGLLDDLQASAIHLRIRKAAEATDK